MIHQAFGRRGRTIVRRPFNHSRPVLNSGNQGWSGRNAICLRIFQLGVFAGAPTKPVNLHVALRPWPSGRR